MAQMMQQMAQMQSQVLQGQETTRAELKRATYLPTISDTCLTTVSDTHLTGTQEKLARGQETYLTPI